MAFWCSLCALPKPREHERCLFCGGSTSSAVQPDVDPDRVNHMHIQESIRVSRR